MSGEDFMLKWNDHHKLFFAGAEEIQASEEFTDVTLSAGDRIFRAHKLVLSICSPYFQALFRKLGPEKPVIFLKDINPKHLELLLQYMYRGEIKVQETELVTVLNVAQSLEVRGLTESSEGGRSPRRVSPPPPAPVPAPAAKRQKVERSELSNIVKQETQPAVIDVEQEEAAPGSYQMYEEEEAEGSVVAAEGYEDYQYGGGEEEYYDTGLASDPQGWVKSNKMCPYCGKISGTTKDLQKHVLTHTNERPYPCRKCDKSFKDPSNRLKHERQMHGHDYRNASS